MAPCRSMRIVRVRAKSCRIIGRLGVPSLGRQSIVAFACDRGAFLACERGAIFRTSVTLTIGHCSAFLVSSAASGLTPFRMQTPCRLTRIVCERVKSCPCNRTTMRSIARAPKYRPFLLATEARPLLACKRGAISRTSVTLTFGYCSAFLVSPAASGPTPFRMHGRCGSSELEQSLGRHIITR